MSQIHIVRKPASGLTAMLMATFVFAPSMNGQALEPVADDVVHSDLPIFGHGHDDEWPRHFSDGDTFGCTSRVAFGDWALRERDAKQDEVQWYRFSNYGVFHCWANTFRAYDRSALDGAEHHPSFFVLLGNSDVDGKEVELWTVQIGARPGSEYLLLSRSPSDDVIESFSVLQTACPRSNIRDAGSLDILLTRYCAVNSRGELVRLARRMAKLPPRATLVRVPSADELAPGSQP